MTCLSQMKQLPGWEQYQSKANQPDPMEAYSPESFNPSNQEVSLKDRLASKLDPAQEKEYGMHKPAMPSMGVLTVVMKKRK